jgi:Zn-dependent protease
MQIDLATQIFAFVVLIFSIIIHEVAHGYAAQSLGDPTAKLAGRLTLNPGPHIDPVGSVLIPGILVLTGSGFLFGWAKPVPYNPYNLRNQRWGEAFVAVAGVATNLILAVVFALVARFAYMQGLTDFGDLAAIVVLVNLSLGLFNLIPIPPIDGFTFIRGILPYKLAQPLIRFEEQMRAGGFITLIIVLFFIVQFLSAPFYRLVMACFKFLVGS